MAEKHYSKGHTLSRVERRECSSGLSLRWCTTCVAYFLLVFREWNNFKFRRSAFSLLVLTMLSLAIQFLKNIKGSSICFWLFLCTSNYRSCLHIVIKPEGFVLYLAVSVLCSSLSVSQFDCAYMKQAPCGGTSWPLTCWLTLCWPQVQGRKLITEDVSRRGLG